MFIAQVHDGFRLNDIGTRCDAVLTLIINYLDAQHYCTETPWRLHAESAYFFAKRSTKKDNKCRSIYLFLVLSNKETYLAETFLSQLLLGSKCIKRN